MEVQQTQLTSVSVMIPDDVQDYFLSAEIFHAYDLIATEFGIVKQKIPLLSAAVYQFVTETISIGELQEKISKTTGFSQEKVQSLLPTIAIKILSPVAKDVSGLPEKIIALGGSSQSDEPVLPMRFIRSFIATFPAVIESSNQHRLENLLLDYVSAIRDKDDLVGFLQRPNKLGGLEMEIDAAIELVELFDHKRVKVTFASVTSNEPLIESRDPLEDHKAEEAEIKKIVEEKQSIIETPPPIVVDDVVKQICQNNAFAFSDPVLERRCLEIVAGRVRDVRDVYQTKETLERSVESGGLGMSGRRLVDMVELIEKTVDAEKQKKQTVLESERAQQLELKQQQRDEKQELQVKEEQVMAKRYVQATGVVPTQRTAPAAPALSRASAAISAHVQLQQQEARIDTQKVRAALEKTMTEKSVPIQTRKPKVQDVQFSRRLTGPIEELQAMSLTEFRRLSADSLQAIDRIKDVVNLLEDQGYRKRVDGLQALRQSPLMRLYGSVTQQALLAGTSVDAILLANKTSEGMKKNEYEALMKLNADLRV